MSKESRWCGCSEWHLPHRHLENGVIAYGEDKTVTTGMDVLPPRTRMAKARR